MLKNHKTTKNGRMYGMDMMPHLGGYLRGGDPFAICPELWDWAINKFQVQSLLDVGCGEGQCVRYFMDRGIRAVGVDGSTLAYRESVFPNDYRILHDYCDAAYKPNVEYDLVWCCEFVEHVEEAYFNNYLQSFKAGKVLLMTHAQPGQPGYHHVNCQPAEYWIAKLAGDFIYEDGWTQEAKMQGVNHNWFKQNGLAFRRINAPTA